MRACPGNVADWLMNAIWSGLTTVISNAVSLPPDQPGRRISAGLASVPGRRALSSLVGPKAAEEQVLNNTSLMRLCLAILSPPHPQLTAWSPAESDSIGHAVHFPSAGKTFTPSLYFSFLVSGNQPTTNPKLNMAIAQSFLKIQSSSFLQTSPFFMWKRILH